MLHTDSDRSLPTVPSQLERISSERHRSGKPNRKSTVHAQATIVLEINPLEVAWIYALMSIAHYDAILACWDAKYTYWAMRPFQLDPKLVTLFPAPNHPSYPAAHGCASSAIAGVEEALFPAEAQYIHDKADEAGWSRLWAGIHFRSDIEVGLKLGRTVAKAVIERAELNNQ